MNRLQLIHLRKELNERFDVELEGTSEFDELQQQINDINEHLGEINEHYRRSNQIKH